MLFGEILLSMGQVNLIKVSFEALQDELFCFLAHYFDLIYDSFVHLILGFNRLFGVQFFGDLTNFRASLGAFFTLWEVVLALQFLAVLSYLVVDILFALLATGKLYEEVGGAWVGEETLLSLLTIFVHGISDK